MKISDHAKIAQGFQSSVNIDFDLSNPEKLLGYVPTSDICDVFEAYIESLSENRDQATFLVGPYGKGKSFLTLALLQVACGKASKEALQTFIRRINAINPSLAKKVQSFLEEKRFFIPVVVNSDYDNLKQSFMVALKSSLSSAGLDNLVPASSFDACREILNTWRKDPTIAQGRLAQCGKQYDLGALDEGLRNYSPNSYEKFVELYNCVTIGQRFNPLVNEDVPKLFADVSAELKKHGYRGLIVVFDEFSKFIESKSKKLGDDLKFIQDFAEKATRSDSHYSLFLCCIAHKPIGQYGDKNSKIGDLLKTVDGRFVTLRFQRGMKENMELIANAIEKQAGFDGFFRNYLNDHKWLFDGIQALNILEASDAFFDFSYGCYPLNPLAAYSLVRVSELVAQNERTLFTFLNGNDSTGLKKLIDQSDDNLISVPAIYDYFSELFRTDPDQHIKDTCYLADAALKEQQDTVSQEIIKSIAVIKIINDYRSIRPTRKSISLSVGMLEKDLATHFQSLLKASVIRESETEGTIDFSFAGSKEINEKAELLLNKELRRIKPIEYLNQLWSSNFYLPKEYNAKNRIVRYCRYCYIDAATFDDLESFEGLGQLPFDVLILRVVGDGLSVDDIAKKTKEISKAKDKEKVIVEVPSEYNHQALLKLLRYYAAYTKMYESANREKGLEAVTFILDECKQEITNLINDGFGKGRSQLVYCDLVRQREEPQKTLINSVFENLYCKSPLINNEMLNRNVITAQYKKTRNDVIDFLLKNGVDEKRWENAYSATSAQNTIWRAFVQNIDNEECKIREVVDFIKELLNGDSKNILAKKVVKEITNTPYGIRSGVIPLFFGVAISELNRFEDSSLSLYFRQKEVELNAVNIEKAISDVGENYSFKLSLGAKERGNYIALLIRLFGGKNVNEANGNAQLALSLFKMWFRNLPEIVRSATCVEYPSSISVSEERFLRELSKFDLNPTEFLFDFLPSLFPKKESLTEGVRTIAQMKAQLEEKVSVIANSEFSDLGANLGFNRGSLLAGFKGYLKQKDYKQGDLIGNKSFSDLADFFVRSTMFDDASLIKEMSTFLLDIYFEDWGRGTKQLFMTRAKAWKSFVEAAYAEENRNKLREIVNGIENDAGNNASPMAPLLESTIRSAIAQFGQSVSDADVKYVLVEILKNLEGER